MCISLSPQLSGLAEQHLHCVCCKDTWCYCAANGTKRVHLLGFSDTNRGQNLQGHQNFCQELVAALPMSARAFASSMLRVVRSQLTCLLKSV